MIKWKKICSDCGSDDLNFDAFVKWDVNTQDWYIENIYDNVYCCSCGGECSVNEIKVSEVPNNIKMI